MKPLPFFRTILFSLLLGTMARAELREFTLINGTKFKGEIERVDGQSVIIKDATGRPAPFELAKLSLGDREFIEEHAPANKSAGFAPKNVKEQKIGLPGKEVKFKDKPGKKAAEVFELGLDSFVGLETEHFLIMWNGTEHGKSGPMDLAETVERVWFDFHFMFPTFAQKFEGRKQPLILWSAGESRDDLLEWLVKTYTEGGNAEAADNIKATWKHFTFTTIPLTSAVAEKYKVMDNAILFKFEGKDKRDKKMMPAELEMTASTLFRHLIGGGLTESPGSAAMMLGFAPFKSIQLTGTSNISYVAGTGSPSGGGVVQSGSLGDMRAVAKDTEALIKKGGLTLEKISKLQSKDPSRDDLILSHAYVRFLNSQPKFQIAFAKIAKQMDASHQVPSLEDLAKEFGFADVAAMEVAFKAYVSGPEFKKL